MEWTLDSKSMHGQNLINFIHHRDLQYFRYNSHGSGCLTWCTHIIEELAESQYISVDALAELSQKIMQFRGTTYQFIISMGRNFTYVTKSRPSRSKSATLLCSYLERHLGAVLCIFINITCFEACYVSLVAHQKVELTWPDRTFE